MPFYMSELAFISPSKRPLWSDVVVIEYDCRGGAPYATGEVSRGKCRMPPGTVVVAHSQWGGQLGRAGRHDVLFYHQKCERPI